MTQFCSVLEMMTGTIPSQWQPSQ